MCHILAPPLIGSDEIIVLYSLSLTPLVASMPSAALTHGCVTDTNILEAK